jgi:hypothetical protein
MVAQAKNGPADPGERPTVNVGANGGQDVPPCASRSLTIALRAFWLPISSPGRFEVGPPSRQFVYRPPWTRCEELSRLIDLSKGFVAILDSTERADHPIGFLPSIRRWGIEGFNEGKWTGFGLPVRPAAQRGRSHGRKAT